MTEMINLKPARTYAQHEIWICADCATWNANGDSSGMSAEDETRVIAAESAAAADGWSVLIGDEIEEFSKYSCDLCKSPLAGRRFEALLSSCVSGEMAAESALVIQRDGSSAYTADELAALMISDIRSLRPELDIYVPEQSAEDDSADGESLYWLCEEHMSAGSALELLIIEDDGYQIYDLRLITESEAESLTQMMEER